MPRECSPKEKEMNEAKRNPALDIVRILATFCVISFHYGLTSGLLDEKLVGFHMFIMCTLREGLMICVPLFLILTGYLMNRKTWSRKFYLGITKTLGIYVLASAVCYLEWAKTFDWDFFRYTANFTACPYAWYIEMYIGLFLMIPFLNVMYHGSGFLAPTGEKQYKNALLLTFLVLTALPGVVNIFVFSREWWGSPSSSVDYIKLIPDWWYKFYPITYYLIGCYLAEYGLKLPRKTCGLLLAATVLAKGLFAYYRADGLEYVAGRWQDWGSLLQTIQAVLAFEYISTVSTENLSSGWKKLLKTVSSLCLGAYLVSSMFENMIYTPFFERVTDRIVRQDFNLIMSFLVFLCSLALSAGINAVYELIKKALVFSFKLARSCAKNKV